MSTNQRFQARDKGRESAKASGQQLFDRRHRDAIRPQQHIAADRILDPEDPRALSSAAVCEQLQKILDSPSFEASERRKRFLRYVVEEMLAGRADRLKGYAIATQVFDRDDSFDPQTDPVVRLEARRLRRALEHYYLTAGRDDPIRIEIPKGDTRPSARCGSTRHSILPLRQVNPPRRWCGPRRPATRGRAGIGSRPPSSPVRCLGRWDGLARTCSLPDCGPAAAGTR